MSAMKNMSHFLSRTRTINYTPQLYRMPFLQPIAPATTFPPIYSCLSNNALVIVMSLIITLLIILISFDESKRLIVKLYLTGGLLIISERTCALLGHIDIWYTHILEIGNINASPLEMEMLSNAFNINVKNNAFAWRRSETQNYPTSYII